MPASDREELAGIAADLLGHLDWLRDSGVREVPRVAAAKVEPGPAAPTPAPAQGPSLRAAVHAAVGVPEKRAVPPAPVPAVPARPAPPRALASPLVKALEQIRTEMGPCKRCKLHERRRNLVFGVGSPTAELVFVGEGPGADEDAQGVPFVGAAGQLLSKMIVAMGFTREQVYICNVVKCRPPQNRDPEPDEICACEPFLKEQLAAIKPKAIVTLGKFAAQTLLKDPTAISRLRGQWKTYCGIPLMPTFHPSYLLRQSDEPEKQVAAKRLVWGDLQLVMKLFGKAPPSK